MTNDTSVNHIPPYAKRGEVAASYAAGGAIGHSIGAAYATSPRGAEGGTQDAPVLSLVDLSVEFMSGGARVQAVDRVSLDIAFGETVCVVGESGSGKSVTSLAVMGLLTSGRPRVTGEIVFRSRGGGAQNLLALSPAAMTRIRGAEIAMIFQEPMTSLNPLQSVGQQIGEMLVIHGGVGRRAIDAAVIEMLAHVGLANPARLVKSYPHEISGGMRQRVMIAMAMMCRPSLIIADEPTTALDVTIQAQIMDLFRTLRSEMQQSMLFITHDLGLVAEIASRVYVMYAGQVVESGKVDDIFRDPRHPYTQGLLASLPRVDRPQTGQGEMHAIPGRMPDPTRLPPGCRFAPRCAFAEERCSREPQPLEPVAAQREVRCWKWRDLGARA
jgi:peptide/nickel transport system ATP-binding protein